MKLSDAVKILSEAGIEDARREARVIFTTLGGYSLADLVGNDLKTGNTAVIEAVKRRAKREPLQYTLPQRIFPTQGSNPYLLQLLYWQVDSLPLAQPGSLLCSSELLQILNWILEHIILDWRSQKGILALIAFFKCSQQGLGSPISLCY